MNEGNNNPNVLIRSFAVLTAATIGVAACGGGDSEMGLEGRSNSATETSQPTDASAVDTTLAINTPDNSVSDNTEATNDSAEVVIEGMDSDVVDKLIASGYSEAQIKLMAETAESIPAHADIACVEIVAVAKGGKENAVSKGWLIDADEGADDGLVVNFARFIPARNLIINGGELVSSDAVSRSRTEVTPESITDVANYFGDNEQVDERTREAVEETFAGLCGNRHELAGSEVAFANLPVRGTDLKLGDIYVGSLGDFVIDGDVTEESLNAKLVEVLSRYEARENATDDERLEAYSQQVKDAAMLISVLRTLQPHINTDDAQVNMSTQIFGTDEENYPNLQFSNDPTDATGEPNGLGGMYEAIKGSGIEWAMVLKGDSGDCVELSQDKALTNLADGRIGYIVLTSAPEGCEPIVIVTTTTTTAPNKVPTGTNPQGGGGSGGSAENGDDPGADSDDNGYGPGDLELVDPDGDGIYKDIDQCVDEAETFNGFEDEDGCPDVAPAVVTTIAAGTTVVTGTAPPVTSAPAPASTAVPTTAVQTGTVPTTSIPPDND